MYITFKIIKRILNWIEFGEKMAYLEQGIGRGNLSSKEEHVPVCGLVEG